MTTLDKKLLLEGKPFRVTLTGPAVAGYINRTAFNLNTINWDYNADGIIETTPFINQEFFITGMVITIPAGTTLGGILIDGKSITNYTTLPGPAIVWVDGRSQGMTLPNYPPLANLYIEKGYVMRDKMELWNSVGVGQITIAMVGIRLRRMN